MGGKIVLPFSFYFLYLTSSYLSLVYLQLDAYIILFKYFLYFIFLVFFAVFLFFLFHHSRTSIDFYLFVFWHSLNFLVYHIIDHHD